jgi:hypothetical protein
MVLATTLSAHGCQHHYRVWLYPWPQRCIAMASFGPAARHIEPVAPPSDDEIERMRALEQIEDQLRLLDGTQKRLKEIGEQRQ